MECQRFRKQSECLVMISIVDNNREILQDPVGNRVWSGWIIQQLNSSTFNIL